MQCRGRESLTPTYSKVLNPDNRSPSLHSASTSPPDNLFTNEDNALHDEVMHAQNLGFSPGLALLPRAVTGQA
jgi:hypothetical protein